MGASYRKPDTWWSIKVPRARGPWHALHEAASAVLVLQRATPGFALVGPLHEPILLFELHEELIRESGGRVGPWAPVAAAVGVASVSQ